MSRGHILSLRFFTTDVDGFLEHYDVYATWIGEAGIHAASDTSRRESSSSAGAPGGDRGDGRHLTEADVEVTPWTVFVAVTGLLIAGLLWAAQLVAVARPRSEWTIANIYGGHPSETDPRAYFAFNQGYAWADSFFWLPLQAAGSVGMLLGRRWGFLLALVGSVPFWYTAINIFIWDRDLGFRQPTFTYWVLIWGMFPAFGVLEMVYCFIRLLG